MADLFTCPVPTALAAAPNPACPVKWDQIVKMLIRRTTGATTVTTATILLTATVSPLLSAADNTKLLVSPYLLDMKFPNNDPLKEGGNDNTTIGGVPRLLGLPFGGVKDAFMENIAPSSAQAMRALASESGGTAGVTNLEAFFVTKDGKLICVTASGTLCVGIPIYNFCVNDVSSEGFSRPNRYYVSFDMAPMWSQFTNILTPADYNALTIVNS